VVTSHGQSILHVRVLLQVRFVYGFKAHCCKYSYTVLELLERNKVRSSFGLYHEVTCRVKYGIQAGREVRIEFQKKTGVSITRIP
jgi:hypothetical protein